MKKMFLGITTTLTMLAVICVADVLWAEAPTGVYLTPMKTPTNITVGWVGDMVPSLDPTYNQSIFLDVQSDLQKPDLMIGNLEGTFATADRTSKCVYFSSMCYAFRGDISFADSLKDAGFDFISLINNHSYDYGEDGLRDTEAELIRVGIPFISPTKPSTNILIKEKRIGIIGLSSTEPTKTITDYDFITREVAKLQENNDFVIVIFHGGAEGADKTIVPGVTEYVGSEDRGNVEAVAHTAIDAGADLVLGAGPHVLRKIERYKGTPIAYSLGNFVGADELLTTTGILALSGIFTATLETDHPTTYNFTSVILSKQGVPSIDIFGQSKLLIESLGQ